jgi:hypothetical protein
MATASLLNLAPASLKPLPMHRFTVAQYHRMIETGVLTGNDRVELLEGWIVDKMPHKPPHDATLGRINRRLTRLLPDEWLLRVQSAITLPNSEPEPDLVIVAGPEETYFRRHPLPRDIALIIEVADSTLLSDRRYKQQLYARVRIPIYWIVNLVQPQVEVYSQPRGGKHPTYRHRRDYRKPDTLTLVLRDREVSPIPVPELLL